MGPSARARPRARGQGPHGPWAARGAPTAAATAAPPNLPGGGGRCGCHRPQDGAAWCRSRATWGERPGRSPRTSVPVPPAVAGERSGLEEAVVGRLVEPGVDAAAASRRVRRPSPRPRGRARCRRAPARASRDDLQAEGLGQTAGLARRPASRRGSRARRHRRSRRCARRRVGGHGPRLRGQSGESATTTLSWVVELDEGSRRGRETAWQCPGPWPSAWRFQTAVILLGPVTAGVHIRPSPRRFRRWPMRCARPWTRSPVLFLRLLRVRPSPFGRRPSRPACRAR